MEALITDFSDYLAELDASVSESPLLSMTVVWETTESIDNVIAEITSFQEIIAPIYHLMVPMDIVTVTESHPLKIINEYFRMIDNNVYQTVLISRLMNAEDFGVLTSGVTQLNVVNNSVEELMDIVATLRWPMVPGTIMVPSKWKSVHYPGSIVCYDAVDGNKVRIKTRMLEKMAEIWDLV